MVAGARPKVGAIDDPVWSAPPPAADPEGPGASDRLGWAWMALVTLVLVGATFLGAWLLTGLGGVGATVFAGAATLVAAVVVVAAGHRLAPRRGKAVGGALVVTMVGCLLIVLLSVDGRLLALRAWAAVPIWLAAVHREATIAGSGGGRCAGSLPGAASLPLLGSVDRCNVRLPAARSGLQVTFWHGGYQDGHGLLYLAEGNDIEQQYDDCVLHLTGPWWALTPAAPDCPPGYRVVPAP